MTPTAAFDVVTADHDDVKHGLENCPMTRSRVVVSRTDWPTYEEAMTTAATLAVAIHGGMAISVHPRY